MQEVRGVRRDETIPKASKDKIREFINLYIYKALPGKYLLEKAYRFFTGEEPPESIDFPGSWYPEQLANITPLDYYDWQVLDQLEEYILSFDSDDHDMVAVIMLYMLGEFNDALLWWKDPRATYKVTFKGYRPVEMTVEVDAMNEEEAQKLAVERLKELRPWEWRTGESRVDGILITRIETISEPEEG